MKEKGAEYFRRIIDSIHYDRNVFTVLYGEGKVIIGALVHDSPEVSNFFNYVTIFNSILDVDSKIKYSIEEATKWGGNPPFEEWDPFQKPSCEEYKAIYYTENATFRIMILWDLLAQLFNIKAGLGKSFDKVYSAQIFHNAQQGKKPDPFAKRVYEYMRQDDNKDVEPWEGNHAFLRDYRDKMTHRSSPNITSISDYSRELRLPVVYALKRVVEDYKQVSNFIQEIVSEIIKDYNQGDNHA